jgi:hypothetical protein
VLDIAIDDKTVSGMNIERLAADIHPNRPAYDIDELMVRMAMPRPYPSLFEEMPHQHQLLAVRQHLPPHPRLRSKGLGILYLHKTHLFHIVDSPTLELRLRLNAARTFTLHKTRPASMKPDGDALSRSLTLKLIPRRGSGLSEQERMFSGEPLRPDLARKGGTPPPGGLPMLSYLYSMIYDFGSLQNIHCKRVIGKYFFLKELVALRDIEREKPGHGTGLFLLCFYYICLQGTHVHEVSG